MSKYSRQVPPPTLPDFDAAALKRAVKHEHRWHPIVWIDELRTKCGLGGGERYIDLWGIRANADQGCTSYTFEIKVSRADFQRDLKQPSKQDGARALSNEFYFVTPPGLLKPEEIPDWAGLMEPTPGFKYGVGTKMVPTWQWWSDRDPRLRVIKPAPATKKIEPTWPLVVSLLRRERDGFVTVPEAGKETT